MAHQSPYVSQQQFVQIKYLDTVIFKFKVKFSEEIYEECFNFANKSGKHFANFEARRHKKEFYVIFSFSVFIDLVTPPANFLSFTFVIIFGSNNNNEKQRRER